ncbi:EF-hand, partial [Metschnikowia bicuspidata var. bicuspidata NRRL YB-4993]
PHQYQQQPQLQQHQQPQLHQQQYHQQQQHNQQQQPHHQRQQPPQALAAPRAASYSGPQYVHPPVPTLSPPAVHLPSTPQMAGRGHAPAKKAPPSTASRSRESLEDTPKHAAKHRLEAELRATFDRVDANRSGKISQRELSAALVNFDNTGFRHSAVRLMIKLFSSPASGLASGLNFDQFVSLWKYLTAYKKLFVVADVNKSGDISFGEFQRIIEQIGYKLNVDLVLHLFQKFAVTDSHDDGSVAVGKLKFDAFIELLVYLRKLTDIFKQYDKQLTGVATIDYLDFLLEISNLT